MVKNKDRKKDRKKEKEKERSRNGNPAVAAQTDTILHPTRNDLPEAARAKMIELLNARLADAIDLVYQAKQAHWSVKGPHFVALHKLFDEVYEEAGEWVDLIAERAVQLGGVALGTIRSAASRTSLAEYPLEISAGERHVEAVSNALAQFGRGVRAAIDEAEENHDADTMDIFTEVSRATDKLLWFVEAHADRSA